MHRVTSETWRPHPHRTPSRQTRPAPSAASAPDTPTRYVASGGGPHLIRDTRAEAEADWIATHHGIPRSNIAGDLLIACTSCRLPVYDSHKDGLCGGCRPTDPCCPTV